MIGEHNISVGAPAVIILEGEEHPAVITSWDGTIVAVELTEPKIAGTEFRFVEGTYSWIQMHYDSTRDVWARLQGENRTIPSECILRII